MLRKVICTLLLLSAALSVPAQVGTGTYAYGTFDNQGFDKINVGDLNVHFTIPILTKTGRGLPFYYYLSYDSSVWYPSGANGTGAWTPVANFGWTGLTLNNLTGYITYATVQKKCFNETQWVYYYVENNWRYYDSFGRMHSFGGSVQDGTAACATEPLSFTATTNDGTGYTMNASWADAAITTIAGAVINAPLNTQSGSGVVTDSNGNQVSVDTSGHFTDTAGKNVLTVAGGAPNPLTLTYKDTSGTSRAVTVYYSTYTVKTQFGCSETEYSNPSVSLVDHITFPDNSEYQFGYEVTPGYSQGQNVVTGRLATVTLPQGGVITYNYQNGHNGIECADGGTATLQRQLVADSGSAASTWAYARTPGTGTSHTEVTDGLSNHVAYDFVIPSGQTNFYETNRVVYQGAESGTPVLARQTCYNGGAPTCTTTPLTMPVSEIDTWETLNGIETNGTTAKYNSYGMQTEADTYDFAASSTNRGSLLKKEVWTYNSSIPDLVAQDAVYDGSGTISGDTTYTYDGASLTSTSGVPQHVAVSGPRGNLTGKTVYANGTTSYAMSATYYDTGSIFTSVSPNGTTTYSYDSTYVFQTGVLYPTPSSGVTLQTSATFDSSYTELPLTSKDFNSQQTSFSGYDLMLRPTNISYPDGGSTTIQYESTTQTGIDRYQNSTTFADTETLVDSYARPSRVAVANGQGSPKNWYQQDVCYDANGNPQFSSYQYQANGFSTSKVCSGAGDTSSYDVLGRLTGVTRQTGETVTYKYYGRATLFTDENGVSRISQIDGLGRSTIVCEISSSTLQGVSYTACGTDSPATGWPSTGFTTTYAHTLATPTTTVTQGAQTRTFQSDWLGRTTSVTEPESGTTTYSYVYNSTGLVVTRKKPKANQSNASTLTTTTYQYDSMSRLISVTYDDGSTATKTFAYDASAGWSDLTQTNLKGRMSLASVTPTNANAKTIFSYDAMGRTTDLDECLPSGCGNSSYNKKLHYTFDWTGNLLSSTDSGGVTSTYAVSVAGENLSLTSSLNNSTNKPNVLSSVVNGPNGPGTFSLGNGLTGVYSYDSIGRMSGGWVCSGGSTSPNCTGGTQIYGFTSAWKGVQLTGSSDSVLNQTSTYGYDEFNRLSSRTVTSGTLQNFSYGYDRYGNRWSQNVTAGSGGPQPQFTFVASTNEITPSTCNPPTASQYCYDAAGNMIADTYHLYTFDAEGNITAVDGGQTGQYFYNALNQRIKTVAGSTSREFVFNATGQRVSIWNGSVAGQQLEGQYYWANKPVAYYNSGGSQHFQHQDWLGTERMRTSYSGAVEDRYSSLPFGDSQTTGTDSDQYHFAALDYDSEANTDHAQFRQYSPTQGRWLRPDPYLGSYDLTNPESLNRYVYLTNNPLSAIDPVGLDDCGPEDAAVPSSGGFGAADDCGPIVGVGLDGGGGGGGGLDPNAGPPETEPGDCPPDSYCVNDNPPPDPQPAPPPDPCALLNCFGGQGPISPGPLGGNQGAGGAAPNNLVAATRPLFGSSTMVSSCSRLTTYPLGISCNFVCENTDAFDPTTSDFSAQYSVLEKACGAANMPTGLRCPSLVTIQSKSFFIGPVGISLNNKILSCVP